MVSLFDGWFGFPTDVVQYTHDCDPTCCELFQGAQDNRLNLIGLEAKGVVCPHPLKRYMNPDSVYLQVLAEMEILPHVFFGGIEGRDLAKRIKEGLEHCLTNSPIAKIAGDIMERLADGAEGRQQCLRITRDRILD